MPKLFLAQQENPRVELFRISLVLAYMYNVILKFAYDAMVSDAWVLVRDLRII